MQPIHTDNEYRQAIKAMHAYFAREPDAGSAEGQHFEELIKAVGIYERAKVATHDPVSTIRYRLEQVKKFNLMPDMASEQMQRPVSVIDATVESVVEAVHQRLLPFKEIEFEPDAESLVQMQSAVDVLFRSHTMRKVYKCEWGMLLTGLEIMFNPRTETVIGRVKTAWPSDYGLPGGPRYQAEAEDAVALGTLGEVDLYMVRQDGMPTLVARYGPGSQYTSFCPLLAGDADIQYEPILHAYFRAALLGHIES